MPLSTRGGTGQFVVQGTREQGTAWPNRTLLISGGNHVTDPFCFASDRLLRTFCQRTPCGLRTRRDYGARLVVLHVATMPTVLYGEGIYVPDTNEQFEQEKDQLGRLQLPVAKRTRRASLRKATPPWRFFGVARKSTPT